MTITVAPMRNEYTATAGQTTFSYTFKIFEDTDLNVYVTPAGQVANDATDQVTPTLVTGVGNEAGGTITIAATSEGDLVTIVGDIPASRTTDYQNNGDFRPDVVNNDFDRVVSLVKQGEDLANRSLVFQESQQGTQQLTLPAPQAGFLMRWNSGLTGLENVEISTPVETPLSSVAALRNLPIADLAEGTSIFLNGYYTDGDGGGGPRRILFKSGGPYVDNGGSIIVPTGGDGSAAWLWGENIDIINPLWVGLKGDGSDEYEILNKVQLEGNTIVFPKKNISFGTPLVINNKRIDFGGSTLTYTGATDNFALTINSTSTNDVYSNTVVSNFTVASNSTDTVNRTHGICIGGSNGKINDFKIRGFTGVSFAIGSGVEAYTGITFPAVSNAFYWSVSNINIAATAGWGMVVKQSNNANHFRNVSSWAFDGLAETPPRTPNCINEIVIDGLSNTFTRVSLEGAPSGERIVFHDNANSNIFEGNLYFEDNASWPDAPGPRIIASSTSSSNIIPSIRDTSTEILFDDKGASNYFNSFPSFYINGLQQSSPILSQNLVTNGDFNGASSTGWSDFSVNGVSSFGTGYFTGSSYRIDVTSGRPTLLQNISTVTGVNQTALVEKDIAIGAWIKTDLDTVQVKFGGVTNANSIPSDSQWHFVTSTVTYTGTPTPELLINTINSGLTGFIEISNITGVIGVLPLAF